MTGSFGRLRRLTTAIRGFLTNRGRGRPRSPRFGRRHLHSIELAVQLRSPTGSDFYMHWKPAARGLLHEMGGLAALRLVHRGKFRVLMLHEFRESVCKNLDLICNYVSCNYEPVTLSAIAAAIHSKRRLPANALTVTVDDGYRNFLIFGHPIFKKYGISTTVYAVAGFADGRLWLWTDQVAFVLGQTAKR